MTEITEAQLELLRDKYVVWDRAAREGSMDLRDYNRRAADALKAALCIVSAAPTDRGWRPSREAVAQHVCVAMQAEHLGGDAWEGDRVERRCNQAILTADAILGLPALPTDGEAR